MTDASTPSKPHPAETLGLWLIVASATARAAVNIDLLPGFDSDPLLLASPNTAIGPAQSLLFDAAALIGAALVFASTAARAHATRTAVLALAAVGTLPLLYHLFVATGAGHPETQRIGWSWLAAITSALAFTQIRPGQTRAIATSALLGFMAMLAAKGIYQVTIEHAITLETFEGQREEILRARGIEPGTPNAEAFLRRLAQPEASGWFGLSNVYATFTAAATVVGIALTTAALKAKQRSLAIAPVALTIISGIALAASGSKGGITAALIAAALIPLLVTSSPKLSRLKRPAILLACAVPMLALAARAIVGPDALRELSLLYRTFYIDGALHIVTSNPFAGVGPNGFQQAFLAAKPAICPEDVTSPHSIAFDWLATLGPAAIAWIAILAAAVFSLTTQTTEDAQEASTSQMRPTRTTVYTMLAFALPATLISALVEAEMATPLSALMRTAGFLAWLIIAVALIPLLASPRARLALIPGAVVILIHSQIEMTLVIPAAAPLAALLIAAAVPAPSQAPSSTRPSRFSLAPTIALAALAISLLSLSFPRVQSWQSTLQEQSKSIQAAANMHTQARSQAAARSLHQTLIAAATDLTSLTSTMPADMRAPRAASRMALHASALAQSESSRAESLNLALAAAKAATDAEPANPAPASWYASVLRSTGAPVAEALPWLEQAANLDPYDPVPAARLATALAKAGKPAQARDWAAQSLARNDLRRLDPTLQLADDLVSRLQSLAVAP